MKVAISYIRWSDPAQAAGNSERRQVEAAERWAAAHGYTLDRTLTEKGRSAFEGKHLGAGSKLGNFLALVRAGVIPPGSALIIENLDRLSRMPIDDSIALLREIVRAGVDIVTLFPEQVFTKESLNEMHTWIRLAGQFEIAHAESAKKSMRSKDNWEEKRRKIANRETVTPICPFWLTPHYGVEGNYDPVVGRVRDRKLLKEVTFEADPEEVAKVRLVFDLAEQGNGCSRIKKILHARGIKFAAADVMTDTTIHRLLRNRQVLGEYQPCYRVDAHGRREPAGEPVPNYFPAVITPAQFARVQAGLARRKKVGGGRLGPRGPSNLFSGLLFDARDGAPLYLSTHGKAAVKYLVNAHAAAGKPGAAPLILYRYAGFETALLKACREIKPESLAPKNPQAEEVANLEARLQDLQAKKGRAQKRYDEAKDEAAEEVAVEQLTRITRSIKETETDLDKARAAVSTQPQAQMAELQSLLKILESPEATPETRVMARALINSLVTKIMVYIQRNGRYRRRAWVWVYFFDGSRRKIFIDENGLTVTIKEDEAATDFKVTQPPGWE